jgi:hypothetical protein
VPAGNTTSSDRRTNHYDVLQISSTATPEVIQAAYRALARAYHPDVNAAPDAARRMRQLNEAYAVLSDPVRRAKYDAVRARARRQKPADGPTTPRRTTTGDGVHVVGGVPPVVPPVSRAARAAVPPGLPRPVAVPLPSRSGPRIGRLVAAIAFVLMVIAAFWFAIWLVLGALEDEPTQAITPLSLDGPPSPAVVEAHRPPPGVPFDIVSSAESHRDSAGAWPPR